MIHFKGFGGVGNSPALPGGLVLAEAYLFRTLFEGIAHRLR